VGDDTTTLLNPIARLLSVDVHYLSTTNVPDPSERCPSRSCLSEREARAAGSGFRGGGGLGATSASMSCIPCAVAIVRAHSRCSRASCAHPPSQVTGRYNLVTVTRQDSSRQPRGRTPRGGYAPRATERHGTRRGARGDAGGPRAWTSPRSACTAAALPRQHTAMTWSPALTYARLADYSRRAAWANPLRLSGSRAIHGAPPGRGTPAFGGQGGYREAHGLLERLQCAHRLPCGARAPSARAGRAGKQPAEGHFVSASVSIEASTDCLVTPTEASTDGHVTMTPLRSRDHTKCLPPEALRRARARGAGRRGTLRRGHI
jgi:hypothetical protein